MISLSAEHLRGGIGEFVKTGQYWDILGVYYFEISIYNFYILFFMLLNIFAEYIKNWINFFIICLNKFSIYVQSNIFII